MQLVLYGKSDCLLCDRLQGLLEPHLYTLGPAATLEKRDINDNTEWYETYWSRIPVLTYNDEVILEGRPSSTEVDLAFERLLSDNSKH